MRKLLILPVLLICINLHAQKKDNTPKTFDLLIGTYTKGESKGIYVYRFYTETGRTAYLSEVDGVDNPSYICVSNNNKFIYSVNEIGDDRKGSASAFSFEPKVGKIQLINKQPSTGTGPCYISVDKDQKHVFVANYASGALSVFPVNKDGSLGTAVQTIQDKGHGVNKTRQEGPHVHTAVLSPDEKYLFFTDLGLDKINIYRYKSSRPQPLSPAEPSAINVVPGHGPRHIAFTPNKKYMYLVTEMGGVIYAFDYDGPKTKQIEAISMLSEGFKGTVGGADIHVSPDGKFLYATNRGTANEIVVFAINPDNGRLTFVERKSTMGNHPRNFAIDPTGNYLLIANQMSNNIFVFRINKQTGKLTLTTSKIEIDSPSCLKFVPAE